MHTIFRRLVISIPTLIAVSIFAFTLIRMAPGDPVQIMLGERGSDPEVYAEMRGELGLDKPVLVQYGLFITRALTGDLGTSIVSQRPVLEEFFDRFPATVELGFIAILIAIFLGIPLGMLAAIKRKTPADYLLMGGALVGYSMPIFWWGLILIMFFSIQLGWTPVSGRMNFMFDVEPVTNFMLIDAFLSEDGWPAVKSAIHHIILPAIVLATIPLAAIARMTRSSLLEVMREDYIRTARAKGLKQGSVVLRHALRNSLIPIITVVGIMVGTILTGAILTETSTLR